MSFTCCRAKRFRDRAEEYLQIAGTSQTPGTGRIQLLLAEQYLVGAIGDETSDYPCEREFSAASGTPDG